MALTPGGYPFRNSPLTNITPFTYRDGYTYLDILAEVKRNVDESVSFIGEYTDAAISFVNNKTGPVNVQQITLWADHEISVDPLWPTAHPVLFEVTQSGNGGYNVTLPDYITGVLSVDLVGGATTRFALYPDIEDGSRWHVVQENSDAFTADLLDDLESQSRMVVDGIVGTATAPLQTKAGLDAATKVLLETPTSLSRVKLDALLSVLQTVEGMDAATKALLDDLDGATRVKLNSVINAVADTKVAKNSGEFIGESGKKYYRIAGCLRNEGDGWKLYDNTTHISFNVDVATNDGSYIVLDYSSLGFTAVNSVIVSVDETMAKHGFVAGASVGNAAASIGIGGHMGYEGYTFFNGAEWESRVPHGYADPLITVGVGGVITVKHGEIPVQGGSNWTTVNAQVTSGHEGYRAVINGGAGQLPGELQVKLVSSAGNVVTGFTTDHKFYWTHYGRGPYDPTKISTVNFPLSNIWFDGTFEK